MRSRHYPKAIIVVFVLMMPVIIFVQGGRFMLYLMEINPPLQILAMHAKGAAVSVAATVIPMLLVFDKENVNKSIRWGLVCTTAWMFLPILILFLPSLLPVFFAGIGEFWNAKTKGVEPISRIQSVRPLLLVIQRSALPQKANT